MLFLTRCKLLCFTWLQVFLVTVLEEKKEGNQTKIWHGFGEGLLQKCALCILYICMQDAEHKGTQDAQVEVHVLLPLRIAIPLFLSFLEHILTRFYEL